MAQQGVFYMDEYKELQQFDSVAAMNDHIKAVRAHYGDVLSRTANDVLDLIARHGLKVYGVAYMKVETIAAAVKKSARTINYATKQLAELGIINKVEVMRKKNGGNGGNVYVINADCVPTCSPNCSPFFAGRDEAEEPCNSNDEQPKNEGKSLNLLSSSKSSLKSLNKKSEKGNASPAANVIKLELFSNIPDRIKASLSLIQDNKLGNEIWKKVIQAYVQSDLYNEFNNVHLQTAIDDNEVFLNNLAIKIHNVVYAYAHGQVRKDVLGFIYGTCKGFFNDEAVALVEDRTADVEIDFMDTYERIIAQQQQPTPYYDRTAIVTPITTAELDELGIY